MAASLEKAEKQGKFLSKDNLRQRTQVGKEIIEKLGKLNLLQICRIQINYLYFIVGSYIVQEVECFDKMKYNKNRISTKKEVIIWSI